MRSSRQGVWAGIGAVAVFLAVIESSSGEVLMLRGGGRLEGELLNADEKPLKSYVIKLDGGGQVTLDAAAVDKVQPVSPQLAEFEKTRHKFPDTALGQLQLANWCQEHNLNPQRTACLQRVIDLDPDNVEARRLLRHIKVDGEWMTVEEQKEREGMVRRDGRWITKQEAELRDENNKARKIEAKWMGDIHRWRAWLDGKQAAQGTKMLKSIRDPLAIRGLAEHLKKDPSQSAKLIYIEVLAKMNSHEARGPLATCAMDDESEEVRLSALDELEKQKDPAVTAYFVKRLRDKKASNPTINRAGVALGRMKDPSAVLDLIQYLVTGHDEVIQPPGGGGPGSMTTTFNKNGGGGGGLGMNQKPKIVRHILQNPGVLDALVAITGQNFGYDMRAWKTWYNAQQAKSGQEVDSRRN